MEMILSEMESEGESEVYSNQIFLHKIQRMMLGDTN